EPAGSAAELPALPLDSRRRACGTAAPAALQPERRRLRLSLHAWWPPGAARDPSRLAHGHGHRPAGPSRPLHALVRCPRARDLLPEGVARLLPHARVCPRRDGL